MNDLDQAKMNERDGALFSCALCGKLPTCPMLEDAVWVKAWLEANSRGLRAPRCTAAQHMRVAFRCDESGWHSRACEIGSGRIRELLCMFCAERCLGRALTLEDLKGCPANYPTYLMVTRAQQYVNRVAAVCAHPDIVDEIRLIRLAMHGEDDERATVMIDELAGKLGLL